MNRKNAVESVKNALWALGFAVGIWYIANENISEEAPITVRLRVEPPKKGITVTYLDASTNEAITAPEATLFVRAPRNVLNDKAQWREGVYEFKTLPDLNADHPLNVASQFRFGFPPEVEIREATPSSIKVRLSEVLRKQLGIDLKIAPASVPEGWLVDSWTLRPWSIWASGPKEEMQRNPRFTTAEINIQEQLALQGWSPTQGRDPPVLEVSLRDLLVPPAPGIRGEESAIAYIKLKAAPSEVEFTNIQPALVMPLPGLPYKFEPRNPFISFTVRGPAQELAALVRKHEDGTAPIPVYAVLSPEKQKQLHVNKTLQLDVRVYLPPGLECVQKELTYDVTPTEPGQTLPSGENR